MRRRRAPRKPPSTLLLLGAGAIVVVVALLLGNPAQSAARTAEGVQDGVSVTLTTEDGSLALAALSAGEDASPAVEAGLRETLEESLAAGTLRQEPRDNDTLTAQAFQAARKAYITMTARADRAAAGRKLCGAWELTCPQDSALAHTVWVLYQSGEAVFYYWGSDFDPESPAFSGYDQDSPVPCAQGKWAQSRGALTLTLPDGSQAVYSLSWGGKNAFTFSGDAEGYASRLV